MWNVTAGEIFATLQASRSGRCWSDGCHTRASVRLNATASPARPARVLGEQVARAHTFDRFELSDLTALTGKGE
jgi:hypothetical protein